jgi:hypothetical protein
MKLSAAIRIGSMTTKQIKYMLHDGDNGRCAMGAAYDASGCFTFSTGDTETFIQKFPLVEKIVRSTLFSGGYFYSNTIGGVIGYLNDELGMSREKIADWVERLENHEERKLNELEVEQKQMEVVA